MKTFSNNSKILFIVAVFLVFSVLFAYLLLIGNNLSTPSFNNEITRIENQSQGDSVTSIEKDLNNTDLSDIDKELRDIENELNQAY